MDNRQQLLAALKSYATEWRIEGGSNLSLESALDESFDKLFVDNHHIQETLDLLKPNSDSAIRQTHVKNVMLQSLAFVKGDFHIGDKNVFVFNLNPDATRSKYQTLQKPLRTAYLLKRRKVLAEIDNALTQKPLLILRGRSGIGKSVLAENYYHEYGVQYDYLMWLPYDTDLPTTFIRHRDSNKISLADLTTELRNLDIPQPEIQRRCAEHIAKVWSDLKGRKLLVIDGVKNADDLQPFSYLFPLIEDGHIVVTTQEFSADFGLRFDVPKLTQTDISTLADALTEYEHWDKNDLNVLADNALLLDLTLRQCPTDNPKSAENYLRDLHKVVYTEGGEIILFNWLIEQAHLSAGHRWTLLQWAALPDNRSLELETFNRICNLEDKTIFHSPDFHLFKGHADRKRYKSDKEPHKSPDDYQTDLANQGWLTAHDDDTYSLHPSLRAYFIATYGIAWDYIAEQVKSLTTSFFIKEEIGYDDPDDDQSQKCQSIFEEHIGHFMAVLTSENTEGYRDLIGKYVVVLQAQYNMPLLEKYLKEGLQLCEEATGEDAPKTCNKRNDLGVFYLNTDVYDKALVLFEKNLPFFQSQSYLQSKGRTLFSIGQIYRMKGKYEMALHYLEQSLSISQLIGDAHDESVVLNDISLVYYAKGDSENASRYLKQSTDIQQSSGIVANAASFNSLGLIYCAKGDYETALYYLEQSLLIVQNIGDRQAKGETLNNIGMIYTDKKNYNTAFDYLVKSLVIREQIGDMKGRATTLHSIGRIYFRTEDFEHASLYFMQSYYILQKIGSSVIDNEWYMNKIIERIGEAKFQEIVSKLG